MAESTLTGTHASASSDEPVTLRELPFAIAWILRGEAGRREFATTAEQGFGVPLPSPLASASDDVTTVLWLGPRSWLVVAQAPRPGHDFDRMRSTINAAGGALFDVSASYVGWSIEGANARVALNRACPLDFRDRSFPRGHCAQSMLGHVNALFYRPGAAPAYVVMVARSLARDAWRTLTHAASHQIARQPPGVICT